MTLIGRRAARDMLDEFVDAIRAGKSRALVLRPNLLITKASTWTPVASGAIP